MASRSSSSTRSPSSSMAKRSERSRSESHLLDTQARAGAQSEPGVRRDPGEKDPAYRGLPPEQRPSGSLPAERRRPRAEQRTTQSHRDTKVPEQHK